MSKLENFVKKILAGAGSLGLSSAWMKGFLLESTIQLRLCRFSGSEKAGMVPGLWGIRK
jgi:hypothetical protein